MDSNGILNIEQLSVGIAEKTFFSKKKFLPVVENINMQIAPGEFAALVGESGCGKTVTALSIGNLLPQNILIQSGKIMFGKKDLTALKKKELRKILGKDISFVFQNPQSCLNPLKKIGAHITEAATVRGVSKKDARKKAVSLLEQTGFSDPESIMNCYPNELSGGMMQRVLIAAALINEPRLLIADEPTTALDVTTQAQIIGLLFRLNKKFGTAVLLITHDMNIVSNICTKMYVMYAGQIVESGAAKNIMEKPLHPYTKALIQTIPCLENKNKTLPVVPGTVPALKERQNMNCRFFDRCDFRKLHGITPLCKNEAPLTEEPEQNHFVRCVWYSKKCVAENKTENENEHN